MKTVRDFIQEITALGSQDTGCRLGESLKILNSLAAVEEVSEKILPKPHGAADGTLNKDLEEASGVAQNAISELLTNRKYGETRITNFSDNFGQPNFK